MMTVNEFHTTSVSAKVWGVTHFSSLENGHGKGLKVDKATQIV